MVPHLYLCVLCVGSVCVYICVCLCVCECVFVVRVLCVGSACVRVRVFHV